MRYLLSLITLIPALCLGSTNEIFVLGLGGADGAFHRFYVQAGTFPCSVTWQPDSQVFPLDLHALVLQCEAYLAASAATNEATLVKVWIHRQMATEAAGPDSRNQWVIATTWQTQPHAHERHVVALLDGTLAAERSHPETKTASEARSPSRFGSAVQSNNRVSFESPRKARTPYGRLYAADFKLPGAQWNPRADRLPLDLKEGIARAKARVCKIVPNAERWTLQDVTLENYIPVEAIQAQHLNFWDHRYHWVLSFAFSDSGVPPDKLATAFTLLDGSSAGEVFVEGDE